MTTVTVKQPTTINVKVGNKPAAVQSINYGSKTIKNSADLKMTGGRQGDTILFDAANNTFYLASPSTSIPSLDAGTF